MKIELQTSLLALIAAFARSEFGGAGDGGDGGGGSGEGGEGGEGGSGSGEGGDDGGTPAPWYGDSLDDDLKSFVGDRDAKSMIEFAKTQRDGAAARVDKVIEEHKLIKPLGDGDEVGEFFQRFRPTSTEDYSKTIGLDAEKATDTEKRQMESAFKADMHPDQYRRFVEAEKIAQDEYAAEQSAKVVSNIKSEWGADAEANGQAVDRAVKALGLSDGFADALSTPAMGITGDDFSKILNGLKDIGLNMKEGGGPGPGGESGDGQTLKEQRTALEQEIINQDGPATADQKRRQQELNAEIAKENAQ